MAKFDPFVNIGIRVMGPVETEALERSAAGWRKVALDAVAVVGRQDAHIDRLAEQLAAQYLLNQELEKRVAWYRKLYHDALDNYYINLMRDVRVAGKRAGLLAESRFNGES